MLEHIGNLMSMNPNSLYSATKSSFQPILDYYAQYFSFNIITLILMDVYGPNDPRNKLIPTLIQTAKKAWNCQ